MYYSYPEKEQDLALLESHILSPTQDWEIAKVIQAFSIQTIETVAEMVADLIVSGIAAGLAAPTALLALQESASHSSVSKRYISNLLRRIKVTAMDKLLRDMMVRAGEKYTIFMGTLDAFPDNLIAEAKQERFSTSDITHTIYCCEEAGLHLRDKLNRILPLRKVNGFLRIFYLGVPHPYEEFAKSLMDRLAAHKHVQWRQSEEDHPLSLAGFKEVDELPIPKGANCTLHADGRVLITSAYFRAALVPELSDVKMLIHGDSLFPSEGSHFVDQCIQEIVKPLLDLGCDPILAWRCLAEMSDHMQTFSEYRDGILLAFKVVSQFRSALLQLVETADISLKRLIGNKSELDVLHQTRGKQELHDFLSNSFSLEKEVFSKAKHLDMTRLQPFPASAFDVDPLSVNLSVTHRLIQRAMRTDMNRGKSDPGRSIFNARTIAILGSFGGKQVYSGVISNRVKNQYFYQDDPGTKSLCTPFLQLMLFSSTNYVDFTLERQTQYLLEYEKRLSNWIALRAAHEFDAKTDSFRYDSESFRKAEDLLNRSVADFVLDTRRRFAQAVEEGPKSVYVSQLSSLCQSLAERTGASAPWLVREMISRYIAHGFQVQNVGPHANDCYGKFESIAQAAIGQGASSSGGTSAMQKIIFFDQRVNIEGVRCEVKKSGNVFLIGPVDQMYDAQLSSSSVGPISSKDVAMKVMERGGFDNLEPVVKEKSALGLSSAAGAHYVGSYMLSIHKAGLLISQRRH